MYSEYAWSSKNDGCLVNSIIYLLTRRLSGSSFFYFKTTLSDFMFLSLARYFSYFLVILLSSASSLSISFLARFAWLEVASCFYSSHGLLGSLDDSLAALRLMLLPGDSSVTLFMIPIIFSLPVSGGCKPGKAADWILTSCLSKTLAAPFIDASRLSFTSGL